MSASSSHYAGVRTSAPFSHLETMRGRVRTTRRRPSLSPYPHAAQSKAARPTFCAPPCAEQHVAAPFIFHHRQLQSPGERVAPSLLHAASRFTSRHCSLPRRCQRHRVCAGAPSNLVAKTTQAAAALLPRRASRCATSSADHRSRAPSSCHRTPEPRAELPPSHLTVLRPSSGERRCSP